jgi:hypothetical protein
MKMSNSLVTEYYKGNCHTDEDVKRMLRHYLPTYQQREQFHNSLLLNFGVLPMFPEPGEHISFSMTRCVQRVFGRILMDEINGCNRRDHTMPHPGALEKAGQRVLYQPTHTTTRNLRSHTATIGSLPATNLPSQTATNELATNRNSIAMAINDQSSPIDKVDELMFPPPNEEVVYNHPQNNQYFPMLPNTFSSMNTPRAVNGSSLSTFRSTRLTIQTATSPSNNYANSNTQHQTGPSGVTTPLITSPIQTSATVLPNSPPPQPLSFFNKSPASQNSPTVKFENLRSPSHDDSISQLSVGVNSTKTDDLCERRIPFGSSSKKDAMDKSNNIRGGDKKSQDSHSSSMYSQYQRLSSKEMLPPIISREDILYYPLASTQPSSPCCFRGTPSSQHRQRRPPTYLQLYVKCDRSEPFFQPDKTMDIMTWYRNEDNHVTADRTLVVRGTTSLFELIRAISLSFGLFDAPYKQSGQQSSGTKELLSGLGCYNGACFLSDVKTSKCPDTSRTKLTPLPIPGFYYKYVARESHGRSISDSEGFPHSNGSTVLSNDPVGLQRTLAAQVFDTPLFSGRTHKSHIPSNGRTRLALVYCAPKRQAYLSARTQRAVLPETIYHFQILLEGIVDEESLSSSFQTQIPIRCVSGIGGVNGGNVIDTPHEVNDLNRVLWGDRDVIGLVSPSADREKNCDKIIDVLGIPLFDPFGNQSYKEGAVDRYLYHIASGRLSMQIAEKTQGTVDAVNGTTDWIARQVEHIAKSVSRKANSCMDEDLLCVGNEFDQKLEAYVTKVLL